MSQVFLVRQTGLAKMNLVVNNPRQQMKSRGVNDLIHWDLRCWVEIGDARSIDEDRTVRGT